MDRQALSLPPSGAFYRGGGRSYLTLYLRQVLAQLWKTSYRLRWWLGVWLSLIGSGALGGMPLWVLLLLVSVAAVGTLMVLGGVRGVRFDPVFIESLWARYAALPYNPWRILRDRPVVPHPLWDAHRAWAHDVLRGVRLPKIPAQILWQWEPPTRIELAAVAVVGLLVTVGPGSVRDISTPLSQITGITQAPPLQAHVTLPEVLGFPAQTLPIQPFLKAPVGSTITVTFPTAQRFIPFVRVGDHKIRLYSMDKQTWTGTLEHPAGGGSHVHLGFVSLPLGSLSVVMDQPPHIQWRDQITSHDAGTLTLPYQAQDDFGVQAIMAHSRLVNPQDVASAFRDVQTWDLQRLGTPPYPLGGTEDTATLEGGESYAAGFAVDLSLSVRDARGQMGETGPQRVVLPLPIYHTPAAAQIYKIRAALIRGGGMADAMRALTQTLPILPPPAPSMFLAIKSLMLKLQRGAEEDRRPIVDLLWGVLQDIEPQKGLNQAQNVQALLDQLAQALPDPTQRAAVMETLKQALEQYFQQLQTLMKQQGLMPPNSQFDLRPLADILSRLEEAAQYGDPAKATQMIEDLKKMMQGMPKSQADLAAMKALQRAMEDLGKLAEAQANLIQEAETPSGVQEGTAARQEALKTELTRLQQVMDGFGLAPPSLDKAKQAMTAAESALKEASPEAMPLMRQALEALNESSQQAMEQLSQQGRFLPMGMGGEGGQMGPQAQDPDITIPQDAGSAQLRKILKDIRDRVNQEEGTTRTYLQNLLKGE
jgi:hypothetical protein